jgi:hypothetical protein
MSKCGSETLIVVAADFWIPPPTIGSGWIVAQTIHDTVEPT